MRFSNALAVLSLCFGGIWLTACSGAAHKNTASPPAATTPAQSSASTSQTHSSLQTTQATTQLGQFNTAKDLYLAQFDSKTDVDDIHAIAGVATVLSDKRFAKVRYHAVAGAYGVQGGLYVPANELFDAAFGKNWSDAHANFNQALSEVSQLVSDTLLKGGDIWIAEAGQSDFSAALIKNIKKRLPNINTSKRIHIVQHSTWNEENAAPAKLRYVKQHSDYHKIADGNATGNGTPGLRTEHPVNLKKVIKQNNLKALWSTALDIANQYNGKDERYHNGAIAKGGLDFSDVVETCWIFGFNHLENVDDFFNEFAQ